MSDLRRLDRLSILRPCRANWDEMDTVANTRFCQACNRTVHDFSTLTRRQAADLVENSSGKLCARITYDPLGRIEFRPDPQSSLVGRMVQLAVLGISALGSEAASLAQTPGQVEKAPTCQIEVKVMDEVGAIIPGANVTVRPESGSQVAASGLSGAKGVFTGRVPPGEYTVGVEQNGFQSNQKHDVRINCDLQLPVEIDVPLRVGFMGEVVLLDLVP